MTTDNDALIQAMRNLDAEDAATATASAGGAVAGSDAAAAAVAKALDQPLFSDHTKGLMAALSADADKLSRASATLNERRTAADDKYKAALEGLRAAYATEVAAFDSEDDDIRRAHAAIQAAVTALRR